MKWNERLEMIKENPNKAASQDITRMVTELIKLREVIRWLSDHKVVIEEYGIPVKVD